MWTMMRVRCLVLTLLLTLAGASAKDNCSQLSFIPGYNFGGEGFDVITLKRKTSNIIDMETVTGEDGSCRVYANSHLEGEPNQKVPRAITTWKVRNIGAQQIVSKAYTSASDYSQHGEDYISSSWSAGLGADASGLVGFELSGKFQAKGSHSTMQKYIREESREEQSVFVEHTIELQQYEYSVAAANIPLTDNFVQALNALPCSYATDDDRVAYREFLDEFGSHVMNKVTLGGRIKAVTVVHSCALTRFGKSVKEVADSMAFEASLNLWIFDIDGGHSKDKFKNHSMDAKTNFSSVFNVRKYDIVGGDPIAMSDVFFSGNESNKYRNWMASLKEKPDVISYSVKPIFVVLEQANPEGVENIKAKIQSLKRAVEANLYERRKGAEAELCTEVCEFSCPYGGEQSGTCGCQCSVSPMSDENCCPKKKGIGTLTVKNIRAENLRHDETWVETVEFPEFRKTGKVSHGKWKDVWKLGIQQAGTQFCLRMMDQGYFGIIPKGKKERVKCCKPLDPTNPEWECYGKDYGILRATVEFKCYEYYTGDKCDQYNQNKIDRKPKGTCLKAVLNLKQYYLNQTCADVHTEDHSLKSDIGINGFMVMAACFGALLLLIVIVVAAVIGVRRYRRRRRDGSLGLLVQVPDPNSYGTTNETW